MKKLILVSIAIIVSVNCFSQSEYGTSAEWGFKPMVDTSKKTTIATVVSIPKLPFENPEEMLFKSTVFNFNTFSQKEVKDYFKNWASLQFNNINAVTFSETDNQILIKYKLDLSTYDSVKVGEKKEKVYNGTKKNGKPKYKRVYKPIYRLTSVKQIFDISLIGQFKNYKLKCMILDNTGINSEYNKNFRTLWEFRVTTLLKSIPSPLLKFDF